MATSIISKSVNNEVNTLSTKLNVLDYITKSHNDADYTTSSTPDKYGITYGLVSNGLQISFDMSWVRLQFRLSGSGASSFLVRAKYGSSAPTEWLPFVSSTSTLESGTLASETYGSLNYVFNNTTKVATIAWKGNGTAATAGSHLFDLPEKLKPMYTSVIVPLKHNTGSGYYMEVRQDNKVNVNIPAEAWTGGTATYLTV